MQSLDVLARSPAELDSFPATPTEAVIASEGRHVRAPCFPRPIGRAYRRLYLALVVTTLWGCAPMIAVFDQHAYENATTLKAHALALMSRAGEPYARRAEDVERFRLAVDAAYEYAAGIPKNEDSSAQWDVLRGDELLAGFFEYWKEEGTLVPGDIEAIRRNVSDGFDQIIRLEAAKIR